METNVEQIGEKTKDRKRYIVVDVLGCLLSVHIHIANIHDIKIGIVVFKQAFEKYPSIKKFCADSGYRGTFVNDIQKQVALDVDISEKIWSCTRIVQNQTQGY